MRLNEAYLLCKKYIDRLPELNIKKLFIRENSIGFLDLDGEDSNVTRYKLDITNPTFVYIIEELEELEQINALHLKIMEIKNIIYFGDELREIYNENNKKILMRKFTDLSLQMETIVHLCETIGYNDEDGIGFDIKVPVREDFSVMAKVLHDFDRIINQAPFLNVNDATIKYKKVDLGSTWIEFVIKGVAATKLLNIFSTFVDNCIKVLSHKRNCQWQEEEIRRLQIDNRLVEELVITHQKMTSAMIDKFVGELNEKSDPEGEARTKLCFEMMIELLEEGVEIHQAITQNESNKNLFPSVEQWKLISSKKVEQESIEERQDNKEE